MQHLLTVDGQVVTQYTETEAEQRNVHCHQPSTGEEETIEREMWQSLTLDRHLPLWCFMYLHRGIHKHAQSSHDKGGPEQDIEAVTDAIKPDTY